MGSMVRLRRKCSFSQPGMLDSSLVELVSSSISAEVIVRRLQSLTGSSPCDPSNQASHVATWTLHTSFKMSIYATSMIE